MSIAYYNQEDHTSRYKSAVIPVIGTTPNTLARNPTAEPVKTACFLRAILVGLASEELSVNDTVTPPTGAHNSWLFSRITRDERSVTTTKNVLDLDLKIKGYENIDYATFEV